MKKPKFTEIFNIFWKHVPFILCRSSQFYQMFYISVNFDFCIMKKLWDLAHEKLVNILGGHHDGTNIHGCQSYLKIHLCTEISKRRTIMQATVYVNKTWFRIYSTFMLFHLWFLTVFTFYQGGKMRGEALGEWKPIHPNQISNELFFPNILNVSVVNPLCFTA